LLQKDLWKILENNIVTKFTYQLNNSNLMKKNNPPKPFLIVVNKDNDPVEVLPRNISMQDIQFLIDQKNRSSSWSAPHSVILWNGSVWFPFFLDSN